MQFLCFPHSSSDPRQLCLTCSALLNQQVWCADLCPALHMVSFSAPVPIPCPAQGTSTGRAQVQCRTSNRPVGEGGKPATRVSELFNNTSTNRSELIPVPLHLPTALYFWALTELQNVPWFMGNSWEARKFRKTSFHTNNQQNPGGRALAGWL